MAAPERLVAAALVLTVAMIVAETYQRWPLPLALAVTLAMLVLAIVMVLRDAGSGPSDASGPQETDQASRSLKVVLALAALAVIKGAVAALRSEWVVTLGWAVVAVGLVLACLRLTRADNKPADAVHGSRVRRTGAPAVPEGLRVGAGVVALVSGLIALAGLFVTGEAWNPVSSVAASGLALGLATSVAVDLSGPRRVLVLGAGLAVAFLCGSLALR